jgi:hypothetical protein
MNYTKPEITSLASASTVIQHQTTKAPGGNDTLNELVMTPPAYEADE